MVNLPGPSDQRARVVAERVQGNNGTPLQTYSRFRRSGNREKRGTLVDPAGLLELERLADKAVEVMERHNPKCDSNFYKVMELLRMQYNMNFMVVCEDCGNIHLHSHDELFAPER